jgi:predicted nucleic acid-binding protein
MAVIPLGRRLYLDANALVYFLEAHAVLGPPLKKLFNAADSHQVEMVTSELSLAELLVLPIKAKRDDLVEAHTAFLATRPLFNVLGIERAVLIESARLRAATGMKFPDAIHVATALASGCTTFISEDRGIRVPDGLRLVRVSDLDVLLQSSNP